MVLHPGPSFSVADVHRGWVRGLRENGAIVGDVNLNDRLTFYESAYVEADGEWRKAFGESEVIAMVNRSIKADAFDFWPDVVIVVSGFYVLPSTLDALRAKGRKVVLLHTESPYEDERQLELAAHADVNLLNDPSNLAAYEERGPAWYVPHAYDPAVHRPQPPTPELKSDFAFVGTGYPSRVSFFEQVDWSGIDALLGGNWQTVSARSPLQPFLAQEQHECMDNDTTASVYASTKVSANIYRREGDRYDGWAMGPREVELAAIGCFFLRESRPESDDVLFMLPTFDGPEDFEQQLRWWLTRDDLRNERARQARAAVSDRTFKNHAAALLSRI